MSSAAGVEDRWPAARGSRWRARMLKHDIGGIDAVSDRLGAGCFDGRQAVGQNRVEDVDHLTIAIVGTGELASYTFDRSRKHPVP